MKVLFIGGTGTISSSCSEYAMQQGIDLFLFNRGQTTYRTIPKGVKVIIGDYRDINQAENLLQNQKFDVVVDWIAYTTEHVLQDIRLFRGRIGQYIFISSASAYHKPVLSLPITESTPLYNPYWLYSRQKIECENLLLETYRKEKFPFTIVRPSHTYDQTRLPVQGRYTVLHRMKMEKKVIIHGDGTSLWVLTHAKDFAKGFYGLLGNSQAIGESFHITSDQVLTWNQIYNELALALGVDQPQFIHVPSELIARYDKNWGDSLLGDKSHSVIFDNTKIKRLVPEFRPEINFSQGAREIVNWFCADPSHQQVDSEFDQLCDTMLTQFQLAYPKS